MTEDAFHATTASNLAPRFLSILRIVAAFLFTRPVAFILPGEMAVAYFQYHAGDGFWPVLNGGGAAAIAGLPYFT